MTLVVLLFTSQALCAYILYVDYHPQHFKTNKTYLQTEASCVVRVEGIYCCEEPWIKTNKFTPDFDWQIAANCVKYIKGP